MLLLWWNHRNWLSGPAILLLAACQTTGVNPTGLTGGNVSCPDGPRQTLDCRGALQQYARDFKLDLSKASAAGAQIGVGLGTTASKLTEADALSGDLIQHYYQSCTLYNACLITRPDYVAKMEKLQGVQLAVRRALVGGPFGAQQNIQINPPLGGPLGPPVGGFPPPQGGGAVPPQPGGGMAPPQPGGGAVPPQPGGGVSPQPRGASLSQQVPGQASQPLSGSAGGVTASITAPQGTEDTLDTVLNILRDGSKLFREQKLTSGQSSSPSGGAPGNGGLARAAAQPQANPQAMPQPPPLALSQSMSQAASQAQPAPQPQPMNPPQPAANQEDLDASLRAMLLSLKQDIGHLSPALASAPTVVGNFTEEGQSWSGPLGAFLRDRVIILASADGLFASAQGIQTRGITVKQVAAVENPNDPKALASLYGADLAITGSYRPDPERVTINLSVLDAGGKVVALISKLISARAIPAGVAAIPANSASTNQLLDSLDRLGPRAQNGAKVEVTTNRPGAGASFRSGEEITYFVTSTMDGYLYLFHMNADKSLLRIFPNQYQHETRIRPGSALEIPGKAAPFKFEASPPFGLETTFAIVTAVPLDEKDFQVIDSGFARPKQEVPNLVAGRGLHASAGGQAASATTTASVGPSVVWNAVTVLIRP